MCPPDGFGWMHVAPAVPDFPKRYPGLSVGITSSHKDTNLVVEGLDLAIRIGARRAGSSSKSSEAFWKNTSCSLTVGALRRPAVATSA